jgi:hypothetical protein
VAAVSKEQETIRIPAQSGYEWRVGYNAARRSYVAINVPFFSNTWPSDPGLNPANIDATGNTADDVAAYIRRTTS